MEVANSHDRPRSMATNPSLLEDLGEEVTGIIAPVSLCMAVTVLLVRLLNPEGSSSSSVVVFANVAYQEKDTDSSGKKFGGALLNAIIFVAVIAGMTVLLFLLFKYKCYKVIYAYMGFAVFNIFFFITGSLFIQVMQVIHLHIDAFSLAFGLFNFSVVGTIGLLFVPIPLLMKQIYLIWVGIIVAYIFTWIPEWTSWILLGLMALYDIAAVLIPGGPLKALVELAIERQRDLPALIYEARPAGGRPYVRGWGNRTAASQQPGNPRPPSEGAPRPVAEGAAAMAMGGAGAGAATATSVPAAVEMRRPASRGSRIGSAGAVVPPDLCRGDGGGSGGVASGGWVSGPSRMSLAAPPEATVPPRGARGDVAGGDVGPEGDAVRSFVSPQGPTGPRPLGEGRESPGGTWEVLAPGPTDEQSRNRVSRGPSFPEGDDQQADASISSHNSQEPFLNKKQRQQQLEARISGAAPTAFDNAAASNPWGTSCSGAGGPGSNIGTAAAAGATITSPSKQQVPPAASLTENPTMVVRPVAPALSEEQLAEAVRRSLQNFDVPAQQQQEQQQQQQQQQPALPPSRLPDREHHRRHDGEAASEDGGHDFPDSIKLGLGDFIFYSVLVGRAAMYDFMTVFAAYLAIIAGLGLTLLCLAVFQKALPALPFSIALGVAFYFLTRFTLEPFLVPLAVHMTYY